MAILSTSTTSLIGNKQPIIYRLFEPQTFQTTDATVYTTTYIQDGGTNFKDKGVKIGSKIIATIYGDGVPRDTFAYVTGFVVGNDFRLTIGGWFKNNGQSDLTPNNLNKATIEFNLFQTSGTNTSFNETSVTDETTDFIANKIQIGHRVRGNVYAQSGTNPILQAQSFAFVTKVETHKLTIDQWSNLIPNDSNRATIDGFGVVLPFPQNIQETFEPDIVTHELLKDRSEVSKMYGYNYSIEIGYDDYFPMDIAVRLNRILKFKIEGSTEKLIIIPRKDRSGFNYEVYLDGDLSYTPLYYSKLGVKGLSFSLKGLKNAVVPSFVGVGGYGTLYGVGYGSQL